MVDCLSLAERPCAPHRLGGFFHDYTRSCGVRGYIHVPTAEVGQDAADVNAGIIPSFENPGEDTTTPTSSHTAVPR